MSEQKLTSVEQRALDEIAKLPNARSGFNPAELSCDPAGELCEKLRKKRLLRLRMKRERVNGLVVRTFVYSLRFTPSELRD